MPLQIEWVQLVHVCPGVGTEYLSQGFGFWDLDVGFRVLGFRV